MSIISTRKNLSTIFLLSLFFPFFSFSQKENQYDIQKLGAKGNGKTLNTDIINQVIATCSANGGGTIVIPKGTFITGTIYLKSRIRIEFQDGAELKGSQDIHQYKSFVPTSELHQYSTVSTEGNNSNSAYDTSWTKALIIGQDIEDVVLTGMGTINGQHVYDPNGEEKMRGPHTLLLSHARNITLDGIRIIKASNYAILGYDLSNALFQHLTIQEGWDGIHIRGGNHIQIRNCDLQTGDDAIAGGYWEDFVITDSHINSSCNGIRIIMPINRVEISHSDFIGPGKFPHRTSGIRHRSNMLVGIYVQPGGWGITKGDIQNLHIHDLSLSNMGNPIIVDLNKENNARNILIENIVADSIHSGIYCHSMFGGIFENLTFRNMNMSFYNSSQSSIDQPWFLGINHAQHLLLENIQTSHPLSDTATAIEMKYVAFPKLKNVSFYKNGKGNTVKVLHSGDIEE